jgi:hypothetical protein
MHHSGNTSTLDRGSRERFTLPTFARGAVAVVMAGALATGALAQGTLTPRGSQNTPNTPPTQTERQRVAPPRLLVPVTGTVGTTPAPPPADAPVSPTEPPEPPSVSIVEPTAVVNDRNLQPEVTGSFSIQRFARTTDEGVGAVGTLILSFRDPTTNAQRAVVTQLTRPLEMSGSPPALGGPDTVTPSVSTTPLASAGGAAPACETLSLMLGALDLDVAGVAVQLDEVSIDFTTVTGGAKPFEALLCSMAGLIHDAARPADVAKTLNALLESIG